MDNLTACNPVAHRIRVYYEGSSTINQGMPLSYNQDTTTNWFGGSVSNGEITASTTTAEGSQNEGKYIRVEDTATANLHWFAGVVAPGGWVGSTGPKAVDIYVPNGAIVPVRTNKNCSIGDTIGIGDGLGYLAAVTGDGDPLPCAKVMETVDRSSTNGLVLAKLFPTGQQIVGGGAYFAPVRSSSTQGREYGITIDGDSFLTGTAGAQSYLLFVSGDKPASADSSGDSYSALAYFTGNNYAQNDTNYTMRALNLAINNRSAGTLGQLYGMSCGSQGKSGGTVENLVAATFTAENYGTVNDSFGGIDVQLKNEGAVATLEYGIRVRNDNNSLANRVASVLRIQESGTNLGFTNLISVDASATLNISAMSGDKTFDTSDIAIPIDVGGSTYYLIASDSA